MMENDSNSMFEELTQHYKDRYQEYGFNSQGADWGNQNKHETRLFAMIDTLGNSALQGKRILDVGCGYGILYYFLQEHYHELEYDYTGIDPCSKAIEYARSVGNNKANYIVGDIQTFAPTADYDTIFCCGIFTKRVTLSEEAMYTLLSYLFRLATRAGVANICFNTMSPFCDLRDETLFYPNFADIISLIKESYGYKVHNFKLTNSHLRYEAIWRFSIDYD
jgi:SAM-dependent methyltransferase